MQLLFKLFWAFLKPGIFGFGGGQAAIPLIQKEVVDRYSWITEEEFINFIAMGNALPGPIATKISLIIGYEVAGPLGAFAAILGMLIPSTILILILFEFFRNNYNSTFVKGMQTAVKPVVIILIAGVVLSMTRLSLSAYDSSYLLNNIIMVLLILSSLAVVLLNEYTGFNFHPAILVLIAILTGGFLIK